MSKSKSKSTSRPTRDPDHYSKRQVPYWWSPEWIRGTSADFIRTPQEVRDAASRGWHNPEDFTMNSQGDSIQPCSGYGRIHAVKENGTVNLYMKAKDGNLSYIQGSIQKEFKKWHEDRQIDYILLGMDPDEILNSEE